MLQEVKENSSRAKSATKNATRKAAIRSRRALSTTARKVRDSAAELPDRYRELEPRQRAVAVGVAAGAAAMATAAGLYVARRLRRRTGQDQIDRTILRVTPEDDGWLLHDEQDDICTRFETKEQALETARDLANDRAPSELIVHLSSGEEQMRHSYDPS